MRNPQWAINLRDFPRNAHARFVDSVTNGKRNMPPWDDVLDPNDIGADLGLGVTTKSCLEEAYYFRGEYQRVVEIGVENLAALPAEWAHEYLGLAVPPSVFGRVWLVMSLAELGRFAEAAKYEAEAIQLAEPTQHTHTIGWAYLAASILHLSKGD